MQVVYRSMKCSQYWDEVVHAEVSARAFGTQSEILILYFQRRCQSLYLPALQSSKDNGCGAGCNESQHTNVEAVHQKPN